MLDERRGQFASNTGLNLESQPLATEADTCRTYVVPLLQSAGWDDEPHSIAEQRTITDGRIVPVGKGFIRRAPKRVDYLLRYTRDFPLAVVEAKAAYRSAFDGLQQAKQYAEMLGLKFAYATNGKEIVEYDYITGLETTQPAYPTPKALWDRYLAGSRTTDGAVANRLLTPFNHDVRQYREAAPTRGSLNRIATERLPVNVPCPPLRLRCRKVVAATDGRSVLRHSRTRALIVRSAETLRDAAEMTLRGRVIDAVFGYLERPVHHPLQKCSLKGRSKGSTSLRGLLVEKPFT